MKSFPVVFAVCMMTIMLSTTVSSQDSNEPQKLWLEFEGGAGAGQGQHVVLIAGDDEYRSEEALPMLAKILARHHGFKCTVLFPVNEEGFVQPDFQTRIPGMQVLKTANVVILGLRFRNLPDHDMQHFVEYVESGKPIIGLRTSTHAFQIPEDRKYARYSWNFAGNGWTGGFGQRVLGDTWISHHGKHGVQSTRGVVNVAQANHPILTGVQDVWGPTDVYTIRNLTAEAKILLHGQVLDGMNPTSSPIEGKVNQPMMPLAWVLNHETESGSPARVFCTTLGAATDFESAGSRRLIVNATFWCANLEKEIRPDLNVAYVDAFKPTAFGFGGYRKNIRVSDFRLTETTK